MESPVKVPKYILKKATLATQRIKEANAYIAEVNTWAKEHGADIESSAWNEKVVNDCPTIQGLYAAGIQQYFDNL